MEVYVEEGRGTQQGTPLQLLECAKLSLLVFAGCSRSQIKQGELVGQCSSVASLMRNHWILHSTRVRGKQYSGSNSIAAVADSAFAGPGRLWCFLTQLDHLDCYPAGHSLAVSAIYDQRHES